MRISDWSSDVCSSDLLAEDHGVLVALYGAAAVQFASALIGYVRPLVQTGEQNLDLQNLWREPQTTVPIEPRSGPVVVTIDYRIAPGSVVPFLAAISERRRIRRDRKSTRLNSSH